MPFFQYVPLLTPIHSPIRAQYNQIQTFTSSNTDQYKHHRPMHTCSFSILAFLFANTGIGTIKAGSPPPHCSTSVSEVPETPKQYTAAHPLVVGIQLVCVVRQPNFPRSSKFLERLFCEMSLHRCLLGRQNRCLCP